MPDTTLGRKLHIVHTESSQGWGGQEIRILNESEGMMARGHQVTLLTPPTAKIFQAAQERKIPVVALPLEKKRLKGVLALRNWLKHNKVDIINTHSSTDSWLVALAQLGRKHTPVVRTRHISAPINLRWTTRWLYTRATNHIVTTGELLRTSLIRDNQYPEGMITSVPTGMDTNRFSPGDKQEARRQLHLPAQAILIGIVATIRSWKGHRYLVEAIAGIDNPDIKLLIVGEGPAEETVKQRIKELGVEDRVILAGQQKNVIPWLHAMDIFVLPSYANEGVPQAIIQAMLCEKPIVSTTAGSIEEAIQDRRTGLICNKQNSTDLRRKIEYLLENPKLQKELARNARELATNKFSKDSMLDSMESIFHSVNQNRDAEP